MIDFDENNLFPLLDPCSFTYADAQAHAKKVDDFLGLQIETVETFLKQNKKAPPDSEPWIGLPSQALQTPYIEIRYILSLLGLKEGNHLIDLGAGYGRMGLVMKAHYPETKFTGYEFIPERVKEGSRMLPSLKVQDLSLPDFTPEPADIYFIYDFGSRSAIQKTLLDLQSISRQRPIRVVGRGRSSRDAIERSHPWLSQVISPTHYEHFSIYRSS